MTLTRWHKRGIIPKPVVSTHPSGRGKIASWPDWVLECCAKIVALKKQGHDLQSAVIELQMEDVNRAFRSVSEKQDWSDSLKGQTVDLEDGRQVNVFQVIEAIILNGIKVMSMSEDLFRMLSERFREAGAVKTAVDLLRGGYNPILVFDGSDLKVYPDFLVGHLFFDGAQDSRSYFTVPLLPP